MKRMTMPSALLKQQSQNLHIFTLTKQNCTAVQRTNCSFFSLKVTNVLLRFEAVRPHIAVVVLGI